MIKPILISWRFVVNIRIRAGFNAASNASVQSNLVGTVECVGFGSFYPLTGAGNSRHPHDQSDAKMKLDTTLPTCVFPRFRQFICVYFDFSLVLLHFKVFSNSQWELLCHNSIEKRSRLRPIKHFCKAM